MCRTCSGYVSPVTGQWIEGDGNTQRHTPPPIPGVTRGPRGPRRPPPDPITHPSVKGIRSHLRKDEDFCPDCDEYYYSPAWWTELRSDSLAQVNRKLSHIAKEETLNGTVDKERREYYLRKKARLERKLFGEPTPRRKTPDEPLAKGVLIKLTVAQDEALRKQAEDQDTSVSSLVRQAVDAWLVL